jgi:hypothetical protein
VAIIEFHWPTILSYAQRARHCCAEAATCSAGGVLRRYWQREARLAEWAVVRRAKFAEQDLQRMKA